MADEERASEFVVRVVGGVAEFISVRDDVMVVVVGGVRDPTEGIDLGDDLALKR